MVTNIQLYLAIGIPLIFNASLIGIFFGLQNSKFDARFDAVDARFAAIEAKLDALSQVWRSELRRMEEVIDARLKHLEQR